MAAKQLLKENGRSLTIRHKIKVKEISDLRLYAVTGLPHTGPVLAEKLLKHIGTVRNIFCASKEEIMETEGIGLQITKGIIEVLDLRFIIERKN